MENQTSNGSWRHMDTMGPTEARSFVPHGILLLQFRIHGKPKCSWMSYKANTLGHIHLRSNLEGNVTYMGEEELFWS